MTKEAIESGGEVGRAPIESLPRSVVQAIYHAVTGKTENFTKSFEKNVLITFADVERLHAMICQQLEHFEKLADPTVTVVLKTDKNRTLTYSSWERYRALEVNTKDLTSELALKYEFVTVLPNTSNHQRCVINISLDSSLPVISASAEEEDDTFIEIVFSMSGKWRTAVVSIDFVDFLIARNFLSHFEEWFDSLCATPSRRFTRLLLKRMPLLSSILQQSGRLGAATFVAGYGWFVDQPVSDPVKPIFAIAVCLALWAALHVISYNLFRKFRRRANRNVIPSVILLTNGDKETYDRIASATTSSTATLAGLLSTSAGAILLNVVASYLYAWLTAV